MGTGYGHDPRPGRRLDALRRPEASHGLPRCSTSSVHGRLALLDVQKSHSLFLVVTAVAAAVPMNGETETARVTALTELPAVERIVMENEHTHAEVALIREAYATKINAAIDADDDARAIELSAEFRDEVFITLFGQAPARRNVA
ncbi:MAG: hypothetical protein QOG69_3033 [Actinomycetota bacterium]|nr:hypothetical protein [Actinomycetota bacterium]